MHSTPNILKLSNMESFRLLNLSKLESFRALKLSNVENFRALKLSNLATESTIYIHTKCRNTGGATLPVCIGHYSTITQSLGVGGDHGLKYEWLFKK